MAQASDTAALSIAATIEAARTDVQATLHTTRDGRAREEASNGARDSEPGYAAAFERLFVAVARVNPLRAASKIRTLADTSVARAGGWLP